MTFIPRIPDLRDFDWVERTMPDEDFFGQTTFAALRTRNREKWRRRPSSCGLPGSNEQTGVSPLTKGVLGAAGEEGERA